MAAASASAFSPAWPLGYLTTFGPRADPATRLTWGLMDISIAVIVIVSALVVIGMLIRRVRAPADTLPPVTPGGAGLAWIYIGVAITIVVLIGSMAWTVAVLAQISSPPGNPALTIEITGHQWWWEARYLSPQPAQDFTTANELHIPVGQPVLVKLMSADVIHSFWIPPSPARPTPFPAGSTWPGCRPTGRASTAASAPNTAASSTPTWRSTPSPSRRRTSRPGARGRSPQPRTPTDPEAATGAALFSDHCGACHAVRGIDAGGLVGPDLTHLVSRQTIASGIAAQFSRGLERMDHPTAGDQAGRPYAGHQPVRTSSSTR